MNKDFSAGVTIGVTSCFLLLVILSNVVPSSFPFTKILNVTIHSEDGEVIQTTQYCQCKRVGEK